MRRARAWGRAVALAVAVIGIIACGAPQGVEPLADAVRSYNDAVRWQRFEMAAGRVPPEQRDDFLDHRDRVHEDLRIHHYEVVRVRYGPQQLQARVHVKYVWYLESRGVVNETHAVQRWQRDGRFWILTGEVRLRGEPMPGVAEPAPEPAPGDGASPGSQGGEDRVTGDDGEVPLPDHEPVPELASPS